MKWLSIVESLTVSIRQVPIYTAVVNVGEKQCKGKSGVQERNAKTPPWVGLRPDSWMQRPARLLVG